MIKLKNKYFKHLMYLTIKKQQWHIQQNITVLALDLDVK